MGLVDKANIRIKVVQSPMIMRIDVLPTQLKEAIIKRYQEHISWLDDQAQSDDFNSILRYMNADNKSDLLSKFVKRVRNIDHIRNENVIDAIPELASIFED
jgi:hypothetical protein